ncbi:hypothetical protein EON65_14920 [archaeon]|nr:MAG: hypothetical protein EON65_14920 [archaeon]
MKDKKARKDLVREKRKGLKSHSDELEKVLQTLEDEKEKDQTNQAEVMTEQEEMFEDETTRAMFGSSVSVSIQSNLDDQWFGSKAKYLSDEYSQHTDGDDTDNHSVKSAASRTTYPSSSGRNNKKPESKLDRALKQAKVHYDLLYALYFLCCILCLVFWTHVYLLVCLLLCASFIWQFRIPTAVVFINTPKHICL